MSVFFVTGTDTGVGKTIASRALIQAVQKMGSQIVGYKPIATGQDEPIYIDNLTLSDSDYGDENNRDVLVLMDSTKEKVTYHQINSYTFAHKIPMITQDNTRIQLDKINTNLNYLIEHYDNVLVEGSFGWFSLMNEKTTFADWVKQRNMPIILVVGIKEGCLNHAMLTANAIKMMGLTLVGWIANRINPGLSYYSEIINILEKHLNAPILGQIPYIHKPETQDVGQYITNIKILQSLSS